MKITDLAIEASDLTVALWTCAGIIACSLWEAVLWRWSQFSLAIVRRPIPNNGDCSLITLFESIILKSLGKTIHFVFF